MVKVKKGEYVHEVHENCVSAFIRAGFEVVKETKKK